MELITQNPYRVLGMFTDNPIKVGVANIAKIRAFARVGRSCSFIIDHVEIFGEVDRSEEAIEKALSQLSNPIEAKTWQLFWINSSWITDNGIESASPSLKVYLNKAVMSLMDYQKMDYAAKHFSLVFNKSMDDLTLFDESYFWENENEKVAVSKCFLDKLIPDLDSDYQSFNPYAIGGWFWWFRNYLKKDNCLRKALNDKYKGFAFERIGYLTETHDNINAFHLKYRKLHWLATRCFQILDGVIMDDSESEKNNCSYEIQILKDKFAYSLLEFCKEIYDRAKYWEASKLMDMIMFINEEVRSLACSYSTLNTIDTSLEVLNDQIPYLAPEECKDEALKIRKLIEEFCEEQDLVRFSLSLIKQCVAPLIRIKDILGEDNIYYRHISTKIADNAIYSAEIDLASAEEMYYNPDNDKQLAKVHLRATICQSILLIRNIEQYNLADKFLQGKFLSFKTHIMGMTKKYGIDANRIQPDISLIPEEIEFMACGDNYDKLQEFINTHPDGKFHEQAKAKVHSIEDAAWPTEITIPNLFEYKRKFPNSHNDNKIIMLLNRLIWNSNNGNSIPNFQTLLQLFPNHPHKQKILLRIEFLVYDHCCTTSDYQEYIQKYPKGRYVANAKERIEEIKKAKLCKQFDKCKTIADFQDFVTRYPTSEICTIAYQRIEDLRWEQVKDIEGILYYIDLYPNGRYYNQATQLLAEKQAQIEEAEEKQRFESCKKTSDFKAYIKDYSNGKYLDKANAAIHGHYLDKYMAIVIALLVVLAISASKI
ncbi:MAG: hypothetical protein LIP09_12990 [Bacteroidales bacterium]|nr:hypothetical protein [Bacteroidales bacterium]